MKLKMVAGGFILILVFALTGCSSPPLATTPTQPAVPAPSASAAQNQLDITILNFAFGPQTVTVSPGTKVTWTNKDSTAHTVTSDSPLFDSGQINPGGTYSFTFNQTGNFGYHCNIHTSMTGTIIVK